MTVKLLDFHAEWCGPCKTQDPILEELVDTLGEEGYDVEELELGPNEGLEQLEELELPGDFAVVKVDVDENADFAQKYQVQSIPTLVVLDSDNEVSERFIGVQQQPDLREAIDELL